MVSVIVCLYYPSEIIVSLGYFLEFSVDRCAPKDTPDDTELSTFSQVCYKFVVAKSGSFSDARAYCKKHYGDLIHGVTPLQSIFVSSELERRKSNMKTQLVWIGAQKEPGVISRTWKWVNGKNILIYK